MAKYRALFGIGDGYCNVDIVADSNSDAIYKAKDMVKKRNILEDKNKQTWCNRGFLSFGVSIKLVSLFLVTEEPVITMTMKEVLVSIPIA